MFDSWWRDPRYGLSKNTTVRKNKGTQARTLQEQRTSLGMRCHTVKQCQGIAHAVRSSWRQGRWRESRVDAHNLLQEGSDSAKGMPEHGCQVWELFPLLAQLQQGVLASGAIGVCECKDKVAKFQGRRGRRSTWGDTSCAGSDSSCHCGIVDDANKVDWEEGR